MLRVKGVVFYISVHIYLNIWVYKYYTLYYISLYSYTYRYILIYLNIRIDAICMWVEDLHTAFVILFNANMKMSYIGII